MSKITRLIGFMWASPLTFLGFAYVVLMSVLGWYEWQGAFGNALTWRVDPERSPCWLNRMWKGWTGLTIGNVVILNVDYFTARGHTTLRHEQAHVRQTMRLGVFFPILYVLSYFIAWLLPKTYPAYDNIFEIDARRSADQVIDVVGALKWAIATGKIKLQPK